MKSAGIFIALILLGLLAPFVQAAPTISYDTGQPTTPAAGKVSATGSFNKDGGEVQGIMLQATNPMGGAGGSVMCMRDNQTSSWSGTIAGLPAGTYNVVAIMTVSKMGMMTVVTTPTVQVTVQ